MHRRLISLAKRARFPLAASIACGALAGLCSLPQAYALSAAVDDVFLGGDTLAELLPWLRLLLIIVITRGLLLLLQEIAAGAAATRIKLDLRQRVVAHLLRLGPAFARGEKSAELATTASEGIEALDAYYSQYLPQLAISIAVPLTILFVILPIDPLSGAILLMTAPLIPFFMYMIGRSAQVATGRQYATLGRLASHLLDSVQGLTTLKLFGQAADQVNNIARVADQFRAATLKVLQVSFLSAFALELLATLSTAIVAVEVGLRLLYGQMAFREALFLLVLAPEFYMPLRMLGVRFHAGMSGVAAGRRIFEVLDVPTPVDPAKAVPSMPEARRGVPTGKPVVRFMGVSYTYPGQERPALDNIDLQISAGERVAIVGESGAGKTTLTSLILGFMEPSIGTIDVQAMGSSDGPRIGWVSQSPYLFHDSLAENIRLGRPDASDAEVRRAAQLVHLDSFADSVPDGYDAIVGEGGARLSSGERQRLALARALLADAPILILDEPTSSLDPENEAILEASIHAHSSSHTIVTIAHRLKTVEAADRIIVLEKGRVVEEGTHAGLQSRGGPYERLLSAGKLGAAPGMREAELASQSAISVGPYALSAAGGSQHAQPWLTSVRSRSAVGFMLGFLRGSWSWVCLSVVLGSLTIGSSVALMGTSAWLISMAALHPSIASLQIAIVGVRFFGIGRAVFRYFERLVSHGVTFRLLRSIRVWVYSRLEPLAPARLMDLRAGDIVTRLMADVDTLENFFVRVLAPPLTAAVVLAGIGTFLALRGTVALALLAPLLFMLAGVAVPGLARQLAAGAGTEMVQARAQLNAQVVDGIQGLADLVVFGRVRDRASKIHAQGLMLASCQRKLALVSGIQLGLSSALINLSLLLGLAAATPQITAGHLDGIMLAPLLLAFLASFEAVSNLPVAGQLWPAMQTASDRILDIVRQEPAVTSPPASAATRQTSRGNRLGPRRIPAIRFADVSFTYPGRALPALRGVSFEIEGGQSLAIVGPSGSGKSTIGNLLLRFWDPDHGEIELDGTSLMELDAEQVRAQVGFTGQHTYLFDTSIYENLRLARRGASRADVEAAARRAQIHDFISQQPGGYDTLVGEHGGRMSAGERQRLGITRMILKGAPIWLLDEPTANLDAATESRVLGSLLELMQFRTTLLVTHRLIGMERMDRILVMEHGGIAEQGSHADLLLAGGPYARLWALQNRGGDQLAGAV